MKSTTPNPILRLLAILLIVLLTGSALIAAARAHAQEANGTGTQIFLPLVSRDGDTAMQSLGAFAPFTSQQLEGGEYEASSFTIPAGVHVTLNGALILHVSGAVQIDGNLLADCHAITLLANGEMRVTGTIDNRCTNPDPETTPGALTLQSSNGALQIGSLTQQAIIESSGDIDLSNAADLAEWELALNEAERSETSFPPVCTATADSVSVMLLPDTPTTLRFYGSGLDPDGGPVTFDWNFDDQSRTSEQNPTHDYTQNGERSVQLTVTDDEGESCVASLTVQIGDNEAALAAPGISFETGELAVAGGEEFFFNPVTSTISETVNLHWDFGDGDTSSVLTATHSYRQPGRYEVTLTATDATGKASTARGSLYVFAANNPLSAAALMQPMAICPPNAPPPGALFINFVNNPPQAAAGRNGVNKRYRWRGDVIVMPGVSIRGGDGGDGRDRNGRPLAIAQDGGDGGSLDILVAGRITFCGGNTLAAGDGGTGGDATATAPPAQRATARGGRGGDAGDHLRVLASAGIVFEGAVTVDPGSGGDGGMATATGDDGVNRCPIAENGAPASAIGGDGGRATKLAWTRGNVQGLRNVTIINGLGGFGGDADATGGAGGNAICNTSATGGTGGDAFANGGKGGDARLTGAINAGWVINPAAFSAGFGGNGDATSGNGGAATANPAVECEATTATGGTAGSATGWGGKGGVGRNQGVGGEAHVTGGVGGAASATGGACKECKAGGSAIATSGRGGDATGRVGRPAPLGDTTFADAGDGGAASATGGRGGDCAKCPAGQGGNGGTASANGGAGGNAFGSGRRTGGDGGAGNATGGSAGKGADCCTNPPQAGGAGGAGGNATGRSGRGGFPGGATPANGNQAGNGGNGGDGKGAGAGGAGGVGAGSPFKVLDGVKGNDGKLCKETPTVTPTATPTSTPTVQKTPTPSPSATVTVTPTTIATVTATLTVQPTATCITTPSGTGALPACTPVATETAQSTITVTPQPTATCVALSGRLAATPVCTPMITATSEPSQTAVVTQTATVTTATATPVPATVTVLPTAQCTTVPGNSKAVTCATAVPQ